MKKFDAIIIWFGKAGKTLAVTLAKKWQKVAVIEKNKKMYGWTCINIWCIPSKKLLHESQKEKTINLENFYTKSVKEKNNLIEFLRWKNFSMLDSEENITIFDGEASFVSKNSVKVSEHILEAEKIFINTGSKSVIPNIKWIENCKKIYTSTELMDLENLPKNLVIIWAWYIWLEFAWIYSGFWSKVTILNKYSDILPKEESEIVELIKTDFSEKWINILNNVEILEINEDFSEDSWVKNVTIKISENWKEKYLHSDWVLLATWRIPNIENLDLEKAGIETENWAIKVNEKLETSIKNIFAMWDVTGWPQFTYISLDDFRIIMDNLFGEGKRTTLDRKNFAYSVFLNPPLSRIWLTEKEALEKGFEVKIWKLPLAAIPKARIIENTTGLFKVVVDSKTNLILWASLYWAESHEVINIISLAMKANLPYTMLKDHIFTHPTISESLNDLFKI